MCRLRYEDHRNKEFTVKTISIKFLYLFDTSYISFAFTQFVRFRFHRGEVLIIGSFHYHTTKMVFHNENIVSRIKLITQKEENPTVKQETAVNTIFNHLHK